MRTPVKRYTDQNNTLKVETFYHIKAEPCKEPWSFSLHNHENLLEISLIISGKADFECDRMKYTLVPGDLVIKNAGVLHSEFSSPEDGFEQYCLGISGVAAPDMPANSLIPNDISPVIHTGKAFDYLRSMTAYLYEISSDPETRSAEFIRQAIENELSLITMMIQDAVEVTHQLDLSPFISDVLDYIDSHVNEPMSLKTLSEHHFVSSYHLAHKFKEETGYTVNQYILRRKLGKAQESLVFSNDPIKKIAADCGYTNLQYFYSLFKKHTGNTPAEMRHYYKQILAPSL